jgi:pimeloyl-ACP methyl ester carboxylesterase
MKPTDLVSVPPIWRESRIGLELAQLLRSPVFRGEGAFDGRGQPVLLIPGFLAGDDSLGIMTRWLRRNGHHTSRAGMRLNVNCAGAAFGALEQRLEALVQRQGQRAAIIGQSRGGAFAKVLASRRPDLVSGIVTLGAPQLRPLSVHPFVRLQVTAVGTLGTLGAPGLFRRSCLAGDCCETFWQDLEGPLPKGTGYVSIFSRIDGIVDWHACLDEGAEHVEIRSSHIGMSVHPDGYRVIAAALEDFRLRDARKRKASAPVQRRLRRVA